MNLTFITLLRLKFDDHYEFEMHSIIIIEKLNSYASRCK
jgi:hypothetical protein